MKHQYEFDIPFVGLQQGAHTFKYAIDDDFFLPYGEQIFCNAKVGVDVSLEKDIGLMQLQFSVYGTINLTCDRCGDILTRQIWDEFNIVVKPTENAKQMNEDEEDPDIYYIDRKETHLHLSDWLYDFVNLSIPMHNVCANDTEKKKCDAASIARLTQMKQAADDQPNPLWQRLQSFKIQS